jgi:hypothetical protein
MMLITCVIVIEVEVEGGERGGDKINNFVNCFERFARKRYTWLRVEDGKYYLYFTPLCSYLLFHLRH